MSTRRVIRTGPWSPAHERWLENNYAMLGSQACAKYLKRTPKSILSKAVRMGLTQLVAPTGHRSLSELARDANLTNSAVALAARADNAVVGGTRARYVTDAWADQFLNARRSRERARQLLDSGSLTLAEAARELGVSHCTLLRAVTRGRGPVAEALAGRYVIATNRAGKRPNCYVFHPAHVLDAARRLRERTRGWLTVQTAAVELGRSDTHVYRRAPEVRLGLNAGRETAFVPEQWVRELARQEAA